jgi:hypothetical protein
MINRVYSLTINMNHPELSDIPMGDMVYVQGDTGVNGMKIWLTSGNPEQPIDLTGCLVTVTAQRSDGHLAEKMLVKVDTLNGEVEWEMDKEDLSVPGMVEVSVQIYDGLDGRLSSEEFEYEVVASLTEDEELYSSTQYDLYVNARHCGSYDNTTRYYMNNIVEYAGASYMALRDTQGQPPPSTPDLSNAYWHLLSQRGSTGWKGTYDDSTPYGVGDMVEHLGSSWICVQECTGQAPPDTPTGTSVYWDLLARIGAVSSVNGQEPDQNGEVTLIFTPEGIGVNYTADRLYLYQTIGGAL